MEKEIVFYQPNDRIKLEVVFENGTVWLTQSQMVVLFDSSKSNISGHIRNFFKNGEFDRSRTVRKFRTVQQEGDRKIERSIDYFNLEMIVSVGNRVKSSNINQFKTWAEDVMKARTSSLMIPDDSIRNLIKIIRNQQVMLDSDLAVLYGVETKVLNQAVNRNIERFPEDFMFQLTWLECENLRSQFATSSLRSQIVTLNSKQGQHIKYLPYAFTEQGVAMLSSVLHSPTAIEANIRIMRAFVGMRRFINENAKLFQRMETIENNFLIIDEEVYHVGASLKDLGKKWFAFSILNFTKGEILIRLK